MEYSLKWDTDGDGIIDNGGFADQTYDAWSMKGARYALFLLKPPHNHFGREITIYFPSVTHWVVI